MTTSQQQVFNDSSFAAEILAFSDWLTLSSFRQLSTASRSATQLATTRRIALAMHPFIPSPLLTMFFSVLKKHGGLVVGSVARYVIVLNQLDMEPPNNINIIVAPDAGGDFMRTLEDNFKYRFWSCHESFRWLRGNVEEPVYRGWLDGGGGQIMVTISSATLSPVKTALSSIWSHEMNFISPTRVYSVFPHWTLSNVSLRGDLYAREASSPNDDTLETYRGTSYFPLPCGKCCPAINRRMEVDKGVAIHAWGMTEVQFCIASSDPLLNTISLALRLRDKCHNPRCPNFSLARQR
ncbi:hypothetical protein BKA70DRAFT_1564366 [Coprinopsis sp. MPI-PUGE-AT-0042]|nr:hypothetical protein BKA70DRAFT_1564366 [Coprinopsis sp. MPI-PUGE-AT-0042]